MLLLMLQLFILQTQLHQTEQKQKNLRKNPKTTLQLKQTTTSTSQKS
jgi:hypothetical protein